MFRQYRKDVLIIFCLLVFVYAYFYHGPGANGKSRICLILAIVSEQHLYIDDFYTQSGTQTDDIAYYNGHYYSDKAIGPSVVGAVFYVPLYWMNLIFHHPTLTPTIILLTFLVIGLPSALAGSLMYFLCLYLSKSRFQAFMVVMMITLGTMYLPYSAIFFSHQFTSSLIFSAFCMVFLLKEKPEVSKNGYLFLIGLLLGWALISEYPTAVIILAVLVYYFSIIWRNPSLRHLRSFVAPMIGGFIPVLLLLVYNRLCFGNFLAIGYSNEVDPNFASAMGQGIMGIQWPNLRVLFYMTLHPLMGIFWESPALLLSIPGAFLIFRMRRYREEAILATWVIGSYLILMSGYYMWWGGDSLGPRHIIPILPFFCVLLASVPKRLTWLFVVLSLVSVGQMMIATASGKISVPDTMVVKISTLGFFEYSNIYSYCLRQLIQGNFAHNWGSEILNLRSWAIFLPLLIGITGVTFYFIRNPDDKIRPSTVIT